MRVGGEKLVITKQTAGLRVWSPTMRGKSIWLGVASVLAVVQGAANSLCQVKLNHGFTGIRVMREWQVIAVPAPATRFWDRPVPLSGYDVGQGGRKNSAFADWQKSGAPLFGQSDRLGKLVVIRCDRGDLVGELVTDESHLFNTTLCTTNPSDGCFRLARRSKYVHQPVWGLRMPGSLIGGVYTACLSETHRDQSGFCPFAPIQVDNLRGWHSVVQSNAVFFRAPLFRTPDVTEKAFPRNDNWAKYLNMNETYPP